MSQARKKPVQDRSRFMVDTILEAATRVFDDEGTAGTTNRIADLAGVSIGSLYQYFPNKQAILAELTLRHLAESTTTLLALCDRFDAEEPNRDEMVTAMVGTVVDLNGLHPRAHAVMRELAPRTPELIAGFAALTEVLADRMIPHLVRTGIPESTAPMRARLLVASLDGQVHQLIAGTSTTNDRAELAAAIVAGLG
jgi:AcrR family transcriptional regulator